MSIYNEISSNKRKTVFIMIGFVIVVGFLGYILGEFMVGQGTGPGIMVFAFGFSIISAISSYFFSDKVVLGLSHAKKVSRDTNSNLYGLLENLCIGAGIKKIPDLYIIDDSAPNAFATGRDPDHSAVVVTSGLLEKLDKRQLEGVLAHELSHVKNYDILLMTVVVVLVGSLTLIANMILRGTAFGDSKKSGGILFLAGFILAALSPLIAQLIKFAVSRSREYLADASAALLTRDPEGLAQALEIISNDKEALEVASEATAHLYFSNPLKKGKNADWFANLFNTHPPASDRIAKLRGM